MTEFRNPHFKWELRADLILLTVFALIGLVFTYGMIVGLLGAEEWIVSTNRLEYRYGSQRANPRPSRKYTDGAWELRRMEDEGHVYWQLGFTCSNGWMNQGSIWESRWLPHCTPEQLHNLAVLLADKTCWPLKVSPEQSNRGNQHKM